jgi:hypothetical protein
VEKWKFNDSQNVAVIINKNLLEDGYWIAYVSHDQDDGAWQFHCNESDVFNESDAMIVSLRRVIELDPSVISLADLPVGWQAWRTSKNSECLRKPHTL